MSAPPVSNPNEEDSIVTQWQEIRSEISQILGITYSILEYKLDKQAIIDLPLETPKVYKYHLQKHVDIFNVNIDLFYKNMMKKIEEVKRREEIVIAPEAVEPYNKEMQAESDLQQALLDEPKTNEQMMDELFQFDNDDLFGL